MAFRKQVERLNENRNKISTMMAIKWKEKQQQQKKTNLCTSAAATN